MVSLYLPNPVFIFACEPRTKLVNVLGLPPGRVGILLGPDDNCENVFTGDEDGVVAENEGAGEDGAGGMFAVNKAGD